MTPPGRRYGLFRSGKGQGIVEYGLMLGLTSLLTVVILVFFGGTVAQIIALVGAAIDRAG